VGGGWGVGWSGECRGAMEHDSWAVRARYGACGSHYSTRAHNQWARAPSRALASRGASPQSSPERARKSLGFRQDARSLARSDSGAIPPCSHLSLSYSLSRPPPWRSRYRSPSLSLAACACAPDEEDDDEEEDEEDASPTRGMAKAGGAPGGPVGAAGPEPLAPSMLGVRVGSREAGCFCVL
jgi:hypothetical protein